MGWIFLLHVASNFDLQHQNTERRSDRSGVRIPRTVTAIIGGTEQHVEGVAISVRSHRPGRSSDDSCFSRLATVQAITEYCATVLDFPSPDELTAFYVVAFSQKVGEPTRP